MVINISDRLFMPISFFYSLFFCCCFVVLCSRNIFLWYLCTWRNKPKKEAKKMIIFRELRDTLKSFMPLKKPQMSGWYPDCPPDS